MANEFVLYGAFAAAILRDALDVYQVMTQRARRIEYEHDLISAPMPSAAQEQSVITIQNRSTTVIVLVRSPHDAGSAVVALVRGTRRQP
jgi:hypothetical protein